MDIITFRYLTTIVGMWYLRCMPNYQPQQPETYRLSIKRSVIDEARRLAYENSVHVSVYLRGLILKGLAEHVKLTPGELGAAFESTPPQRQYYKPDRGRNEWMRRGPAFGQSTTREPDRSQGLTDPDPQDLANYTGRVIEEGGKKYFPIPAASQPEGAGAPLPDELNPENWDKPEPEQPGQEAAPQP